MIISTTNVNRLRDTAGHLLISRVVNRDDWVSQSVFDIAAGDRKSWTVTDWDELLADLDACQLCLSDWLDLNLRRG